MLKFTGNPLVDIGASTIVAFSKKRDISSVSLEDMEDMANYIYENYPQKPLQGFLQGAIFANSGYTNPNISEEARTESIQQRLFAFHNEPDAHLPPCAICGSPASLRVERDYFPLLTGRNVINFYPNGNAGLPICGTCLLCVQAYPLGSAGLKVLVHSDSPKVTLHFAKAFLEENRVHIDIGKKSGEKEALRTEKTINTLIINTLLDADFMRSDKDENEPPFSITVYAISNYGPDPSLSIHHLPSQIISFLGKMNSAEYLSSWNAIVLRAWETPFEKRGKQEQSKKFVPRKNYLYEDLFNLPENAIRFLRVYLLRIAVRYTKDNKSDPRANYSLKQESKLVSWKITDSFIRSILNMDKSIVEQIRNLGDKLGDYVHQTGDKSFYTQFFAERRYDYFRDLLMQVNRKQLKALKPPIITLDEFYYVFEADIDDIPRYDRWKLARDLVLIRMTEYLYQSGQIQDLAEALPEQDDTVQE